MYKKITIIIILALILGIILYYRPFEKPNPQVFKIEQILPDADLVGKLHVLDFLKETSELLVFNDVPRRQFLTYEFMLSLAKSYGIDLQSQLYLFANERGDYGFVIPLINSTKLDDAFERIQNDFDVSDTLIGNDKVFEIKDQSIYFFKREKFAFFYKGNYFNDVYNQLSNTSGVIRDSWDKLF